MRSRVSFFWVCILFVFITGCATAKFTQTGQNYPPYHGPVKVLSASPQGVKYEEIGIVSSVGGIFNQWAELIAALQKKAAQQGANAIIIGGAAETAQSMVTYNPTFGLQGGSFPRKDMIAVAIRIFDN